MKRKKLKACSKLRYSPAFFLPLIMVFATAMIVIIGGVLTLTISNYSLVRQKADSNSALNVAEAGVNYYLWHLSHNPQDFCDGQTCNGNGPYGPYVHNYFDASGNANGSYSITVTRPVTGSAAVTVKSVGTSANGQKRTILSSLGIPSFAQYSFVTNSEAWFGSTETTNGPVHSNTGVHFDGTANGVVSSATQTYVPSSCFGGDGTTKNGVWGTGGPTTYWNFPVPQINFNQITSNLSALQTAAQASGIYLPTLINAQGHRTYSGYALQFNANGTVTVGDVTGSQDNGGISGNGCSTHPSYTSLMQTVRWESAARALPANGIIFAADNVWVWGTITAPTTVASGRLPDTPSTNTNVFLQNNITYAAMDGSDSLGIISQGDMVVNSASANILTLDAFLLSQNGKVFRPYYPSNIKSNITVYGGIGSNSWWTWSWVNGSNQVTSGYQTTTSTYDPCLALNPPPLFPQTGSFAILSWREEPIL